MVRGILALALLASSATAAAAPVTVRVVDVNGKPVRDAVVTLRPASGAQRPSPGGNFTVSQEDLEFHPFVLVVPVGASVAFPNKDSTRHHVYSFSPAKKFELKLFAKDQSRRVTFDKAGIVPLGCNIHDAMTAFIVVSDSAWSAKTGPNGTVQFASAPGGPARVQVWHPYLRARSNIVEQLLPAPQRNLSMSVALRPAPMAMSHGY
jgi:plastocyanin